MTVSVVVQVLTLPASSIAVIVIVVCPVPTRVPAVGDCVKVIKAPEEQLSVTVTPARTLGTVPWQLPSAEMVVAAGHVIVGGVLSFTVTVKEH